MKSPVRAKHLLLSLSALLLLSSASVAHEGDNDEGGKGNYPRAGAGPGGGYGSSGPFPSFNVDLLSQVRLEEMLGNNDDTWGNSVWGWVDPQTGREYALMGRTDGTSFFDITTPTTPVQLGFLPTASGVVTSWRDMRTHGNYAYIVQDAANHGMQVFDMTRLRNVDLSGGPVTFTQDALYTGFANAHNLQINQATGFAYAVGTNTYSGGLHAVDLSNPLNPTQAGGFAGDGYTHDAQIVVYNGPDPTFAGREIAFAANEDTVTVVDVTDKSAMTLISRNLYPQAGYTHQGWLSDDQRYFFANDEFDEQIFNVPTRTHIWDMLSLASPTYLGFYEHPTTVIDHNLYVKDGYIYEANYSSGLRVLDARNINPAAPNLGLETVAWLDTHPQGDPRGYYGAWNVYPFFPSGSVILSDINSGLFVMRVNGLAVPSAAAPEPGTLALGVIGLAALGSLRLRKPRRH